MSVVLNIHNLECGFCHLVTEWPTLGYCKLYFSRGREEGEREGRGGEGGKKGRGRDSGEGREEREREG